MFTFNASLNASAPSHPIIHSIFHTQSYTLRWALSFDKSYLEGWVMLLLSSPLTLRLRSLLLHSQVGSLWLSQRLLFYIVFNLSIFLLPFKIRFVIIVLIFNDKLDIMSSLASRSSAARKKLHVIVVFFLCWLFFLPRRFSVCKPFCRLSSRALSTLPLHVFEVLKLQCSITFNHDFTFMCTLHCLTVSSACGL